MEKGVEHIGKPIRFESRVLPVDNRIENIDNARFERQCSVTRFDFRYLLYERPIAFGRNLFYFDPILGRSYWIDFDGDTVSYGITNCNGEGLNTSLTRWNYTALGFAICHFCGPSFPNAPEGIGDCNVVLCEPILRVPLPLPA